jgi:hypothetical protein
LKKTFTLQGISKPNIGITKRAPLNLQMTNQMHSLKEGVKPTSKLREIILSNRRLSYGNGHILIGLDSRRTQENPHPTWFTRRNSLNPVEAMGEVRTRIHGKVRHGHRSGSRGGWDGGGRIKVWWSKGRRGSVEGRRGAVVGCSA